MKILRHFKRVIIILISIFPRLTAQTQEESSVNKSANKSITRDSSKFVLTVFAELGPPAFMFNFYSLNSELNFKGVGKKNFTSTRLGVSRSDITYFGIISAGRLLKIGKRSFIEFGAAYGLSEYDQSYNIILGYRMMANHFLFKCAFTPFLYVGGTPSKGKIWIQASQLPDNLPVKITVRDCLGKLVIAKEFERYEDPLMIEEFNNLKNGYYYLELTSGADNNSLFAKVVKLN